MENRTDATWPSTFFVPNLTGAGCESVYDVMSNWGANHSCFTYGHIGADAITLARAEAGPGADEAAIAAAMQRVLERHPEWKAPAAAKKTTGGFQLGADPDAAAKPTAPQKDPAGAKRWNRFK